MKSCKKAALKLIQDIRNDCCIAAAMKEALEGLTRSNAELLSNCVFLADPESTIKALTRLADVMREAVVVAEFDNGTQVRLVHSDDVCIDALREYKQKGIKAWIELE